MSCERCTFVDIDDHVFCVVCLGAPTAEQLKQLLERRDDEQEHEPPVRATTS
jgi:hypothetical protein